MVYYLSNCQWTGRLLINIDICKAQYMHGTCTPTQLVLTLLGVFSSKSRLELLNNKVNWNLMILQLKWAYLSLAFLLYQQFRRHKQMMQHTSDVRRDKNVSKFSNIDDVILIVLLPIHIRYNNKGQLRWSCYSINYDKRMWSCSTWEHYYVTPQYLTILHW